LLVNEISNGYFTIPDGLLSTNFLPHEEEIFYWMSVNVTDNGKIVESICSNINLFLYDPPTPLVRPYSSFALI